MNGPTYRTSARIEIDREALTAGARATRLSHAKEKTACVAVGRKVRGVYGDVCKLPVYDAQGRATPEEKVDGESKQWGADGQHQQQYAPPPGPPPTNPFERRAEEP